MNWWRHVIAMEFRKILAYRTDFWITFLGQTFIQLAVARSLWQMIFESNGVTEMNGFTLEAMTLYYVIAPVGSKVLMGENFGFLGREIYDGTFTRYLLYPLSFFQFKSLTYLTHSLFYCTQLMLFYLIFRNFVSDIPFEAKELSNLILGMGLFMLAAVTYLSMELIIELLSLWVDNIWSLAVMLRFISSFLGGGFIPLTFMPEWSQNALQYTPFPYLYSLPARTIMGLTSSEQILQGAVYLIFWTVLFGGIVSFVWNRGNRRYTGVGI